MHTRQVILEEIATRLGNLDSGTDIYQARVLAVQSAPAIAYEATSDQISTTYKTDTEYVEQIRDLSVVITVVALTADSRDDLALEVEKSMAPDFGIESSLLGTSLEADGEGDRPLYGCQLSYEFSYSVREDAADLTVSGSGVTTNFVSEVNGIFGDVEVQGAGTTTITSVGQVITVSGSPHDGGALDHGDLTGLSDDDHTIYTKADGTRAFTGDQSFGGNDLLGVRALVGATVSGTTEGVFGDAGTEDGHVNINGTNRLSVLKASDIGQGKLALIHKHRHDTNFPPADVFSRSNSDTESHSSVTNGQALGRTYYSGWSGSHYDVGAMTEGVVDGSGSISSSSMPSVYNIRVNANGSASLNPPIVMSVSGSGGVGVDGDLTVAGDIKGNGYTGVRSWTDDGGSPTHTVTVVGGIITSWTTA